MKYCMDFVTILVLFPPLKNFENPLRIDKVVAMILVYYFFVTQCSFFCLMSLHAKLRQSCIIVPVCSVYCL